MSSLGTGYDLSVTSYSPDGRLYQIEYADKAVKKSGTAIGLCCKDGVVLGVEKMIPMKMLEPSSNRRIFNCDYHVGCAIAGWQPDGRQLVNKIRKECNQYSSFYGSPIPSKVLSERVSSKFHFYTMYWWLRPYGTSILLASYDKKDGYNLNMAQPSGETYSYHGCAIGKGKEAAKTEIEKIENFQNLTCKQAVKEIAKIIYNLHDYVKDKEFELELSWICKDSNNVHTFVPKNIKEEAIKFAKASMNDEEDEDEEEL